MHMMKSIKLLVLIILTCTSAEVVAQATEKVEMADVLRQEGKIYTVVVGLVIILTALIILLIRVDKRISRLESQEKMKL